MWMKVSTMNMSLRKLEIEMSLTITTIFTVLDDWRATLAEIQI